MPQNKAVDNRHELYLVPNPDPFAQNSGPDVEHNDTVEALYDTINDHNFPFISRVKKSYTVTRPSNPVQESTLDKTEEEYMSPEYNIPKVAEQGEVGNYKLLYSTCCHETAQFYGNCILYKTFMSITRHEFILGNL